MAADQLLRYSTQWVYLISHFITAAYCKELVSIHFASPSNPRFLERRLVFCWIWCLPKANMGILGQIDTRDSSLPWNSSIFPWQISRAFANHVTTRERNFNFHWKKGSMSKSESFWGILRIAGWFCLCSTRDILRYCEEYPIDYNNHRDFRECDWRDRYCWC